MLVILGWAIARDIGRGLGPRAVPAPGPRDGRNGGVPAPPRRRSCSRCSSRCGSRASKRKRWRSGGAFTAVIFGLAAQQTLGNLIAGHGAAQRAAVPGRRARAPAGRPAGGQIEGTVSSLGLLYTTFATGETRSWCPTASCSTWRCCRCGSPRPSTCGRACAPGMTPATCRRSSSGRCRRRCATRRGSRSRSSTARRSWCGSRRRRGSPARAVSWPANCSASSPARRARGRRRTP